MKKKLTILLLIFTFIFGLTLTQTVTAEEPKEDETYLYSTKSGVLQKVYHYGKGGEVTIPKNFTVYESEMRGIWVATVYNIAIGKQQGTSQSAIDDYKAEFLSILDRMEEFGMNTLYFQIRPSNDAFYKSELNPWSQYLVGPGIDPGWDPLTWMIDETHKRGFDFQCWMNAYRVTTHSVLPDGDAMASVYSTEQLLQYKKEALKGLADKNFAKLHPEYVVLGEYDTRLILNPSEVAVQQFIVDSLKEIVENYDIDGMHFDDYFYLNGYVSSDIKNTSFAGGEKYNATLVGENTLNDLPNYQEYLDGSEKYAHMERGYSLGDFRRENVNHLMREIRKMVDEYNAANNDNVEFGAKPAAVWQSNSEFCPEGSTACSPEGSNTHEGAYASYKNLFADSLKWVREGLVDYIAPQVYYSFEDNYAPYADVVDWWAEKVDEVNAVRTENGERPIKLYIAHGIYKYRDASDQFYNASEIRNQIVYNKKHDSIVGSAFYSYECFYEFSSETHEKGVTYLKNNYVKNPVFPIQRGEDDSAGLKVTDYNISYDELTGKHIITFDNQPGFRAFGLYKVQKGETFDTTDVKSRIIVKYDPYVEGEKVKIELTDYDENYDYYLKIVSTNGHVSKDITKFDFSKTQNITSIKISNLSEVPAEVQVSSNYTLTANVENNTGKTLNYKVYLVQRGTVRTDRVLASGTIKSGSLSVNIKMYSNEMSNIGLCLELTDGEASLQQLTNTFNLVAKAVAPTNTYKITYDVDGGLLPDNAPASYKTGSVVILPEPTKDGYVFEGWKLDGEYIEYISDTMKGDVHLVADWTVDPSEDGGSEGGSSCNMTSVKMLLTLSAALGLMVVALRKNK